MSAALLVTLGLALAFVNGANDVSKGIATLVGSGVSDYRRAILWGTLWTAIGGLLGAALATKMVTTFGSGLLAPGTAPTVVAGVATLLGASAWVLVATRSGLPVSTTHAIVGSLVGVATVAYGVEGVRWSTLGSRVVLPLLLTPALAFGLVVLLLRVTRRFAGTRGNPAPDCVCVSLVAHAPALAAPTAFAVPLADAPAPALDVLIDTQGQCAASRPEAARLTLDRLHWMTAGAASFARGMNDAPKIVALVLAASALHGASSMSSPVLFVCVSVGMLAGSLVAGRRVTKVLAEKVTPMDHREGFLANLVTAALVTAGATLGLPMSTTHVSSGGIVGAGAQRAALNRRTVRDMALAWIVTVPAAAFFGVVSYSLGRWVS